MMTKRPFLCGIEGKLVVQLPLAWLALCLGLAGAIPAWADDTRDQQIAAIQARRDDAIARVKEIINQPVTQLPRTPEMTDVTTYPYWFHDGASVPNYDTVDVRATQDFHYDNHQYAASDLNPGVVFIGRELEFNAMTKYFHTNRSLPKKRLTEAEMLNINEYYRDIGYCDHQLVQLQFSPPAAASQEAAAVAPGPETPLNQARQLLATHKPGLAGIGAVLLAGLWYLRRHRHAANSQ